VFNIGLGKTDEENLENKFSKAQKQTIKRNDSKNEKKAYLKRKEKQLRRKN
jgi:hypothetical protein